MHFLIPQALWLLTLVPIGTFAVYGSWRQKQAALKLYGEPRLVAGSSSKGLHHPHAWARATFFTTLALISAVAAISRPSLENGRQEFLRGTVDVVAVIDVSRSMAAEDYRGLIPGDPAPVGTRINASRYILLNEVIGALAANRLGVVSYAGEPKSQAFLTDDMPALTFVLSRALTVGSAPGEGSRLAWALARACRVLDLDSPTAHKRVVLLFSDGGNDDKPEQLQYAIRELRKRNVELIVVGLGSRKPTAILSAHLPAYDREKSGGNRWYEVNGQPVTTSIDEKLLNNLARQAGGTYVRVNSPADFRLTSFVSGVETRYRSGEQELYMLPLLASIAFLALSAISDRERRRKGGQGT